jgi:hypothetical protein
LFGTLKVSILKTGIFMDYRPPKPIDESFTITQVKWLKKFSNLVAVLAGGVAFLDQIGAGALLPAKIQKYITPGVAIIAVTAFYTGNKKVGAALYADHANRSYNYTPDGTPGRSKQNALYQVFMTGAELVLAQKATSGQLVPASAAQQQETSAVGVVLPPVDIGLISHYAPNPVPTLTELAKGRKVSLSDLAAIAQEQN